MATLALSSGESELGAVVKACGEGLGIQSILADFGWVVKVTVCSDATAAIGMCRREGLGRVRHLSTGDLWVQQLVRRKLINLDKCPTTTNPSDMLTKGIARDRIQSLLQLIYTQAQGGRASIAPIRPETVPRYGPTSFDEVDSDTEE